MLHVDNPNPLIHGDQASTIDAIHHKLDWMIVQKGHDPEAHPGEVFELRTVLAAVAALRRGNLHN